MPDLTEVITGKPKRGLIGRTWDAINAPIWEGPTRAGKAISEGMESIPTMQQTGQGGLRDWLGWADASAKGFLQGATEAGGQVLSDMTSPLSLSMEALGGGAAKRLAGLRRLATNANRTGSVVEGVTDATKAINRAGPEFVKVGGEVAENTGRAARMAEEARAIKDIARKGDTKPGIGHSAPEEVITRQKLPQIEDAYMPTSENAAGINLGSRATSVFRPEVAKEHSRMMVELMDEGPMKDAMKIAQEKYPRLMGHIDELNVGPVDASPSLMQRFFGAAGSSGSSKSSLPGSTGLSRITLNPESSLNWSPQGMADTIGHELAHVAQRLRRGHNKMGIQYDLAEKAFGYSKNPFEVQARKSGSKFADYAMRNE